MKVYYFRRLPDFCVSLKFHFEIYLDFRKTQLSIKIRFIESMIVHLRIHSLSHPSTKKKR